MSKPVKDRLYNLLPTIYRIADAQQGRPLSVLLRVIEDEMRALEQDIDGLYDDWFIETCAEWVIPYIGDLLGIQNMQYQSQGSWNLRSYVANTLAYRRRKGTAAVLERVAHDATGWSAHSVEFFQLAASTQHLSHLRPHNLQSPDLRNRATLETLEGPFESVPHTIDVRRIAVRKGKYNIRNIGIFLWRLQSYSVKQVTACRIKEGCFTFDPTGRDVSLFNQLKTDARLSEEFNIPGPLRFSPLQEELKAGRQRSVSMTASPDQYFGNQPVFTISLVSEKMTATSERLKVIRKLSTEETAICDLSDWRAGLNPSVKEGISVPTVAVDPSYGRIVLSERLLSQLKFSSQNINEVLVDYSYGFSGDVGAGPYDRSSSIKEALNDEINWQAGVTKDKTTAEGKVIFNTINDALKEWKKVVDDWKRQTDRVEGRKEQIAPRNKVGLITIMDSRTYREDLKIEVPDGCQLLIVAADWPTVEDPIPGSKQMIRSIRSAGQFTARKLRPHLLGKIDVYGTTDANSLNPGELVINGLLIEGELKVQEGNLGSLQIANSTIVPDKGDIRVFSREDKDNDSLKLIIKQTICGKIELSDRVPRLIIVESIIDPCTNDAMAVNAIGTSVQVEQSTILGKSRMGSLIASNSIFNNVVRVKQSQVGCMRFCYLPFGSQTPRRFRCQPDLSSEVRIDAIRNRPRPTFNSLHYGDSSYAQLSQDCPEEISAGAEDSSEMGVFKSLCQPQREANLSAALEEYLPIGLDAGIFYVT